jgi:serine O-acetyltransferase
MIKTKQDLLYYLEADRLSLGFRTRRPAIYGDWIWKFERLLREREYLLNSPTLFFRTLRLKHNAYRFSELSLKLGFTIPPNIFGPGLSIAHYGHIIVNDYARIGKNCRIHSGVNIGVRAGTTNEAPVIGDNVYIGPGAKIFGRVEIADDIAIGANAVVTKSFTTPRITIAGVPAKKISDRGSEGYLEKGADLAEKFRG